jgi:hypothetical protein
MSNEERDDLWKNEFLTQNEVADYFRVVPSTIKSGVSHVSSMCASLVLQCSLKFTVKMQWPVGSKSHFHVWGEARHDS